MTQFGGGRVRYNGPQLRSLPWHGVPPGDDFFSSSLFSLLRNFRTGEACFLSLFPLTTFLGYECKKGSGSSFFLSIPHFFLLPPPHDRRAQVTNDLLSGEGDPAKKEASLIKLSG